MSRCVEGAWENLNFIGLSEDHLLTANGQELILLPRNVKINNRRELHISLAKFMITQDPRCIALGVVQLIEVYIPVLATSREPHIVMEPVNTHDFTLMTMELEALSVHAGVKVVDVNVLLRNHASE